MDSFAQMEGVPRNGRARRLRIRVRALAISLIGCGAVLVSCIAYASFGTYAGFDALLVNGFVVLPLGCVLLGYSFVRRSHRVLVALGFLGAEYISYDALCTFPGSGEPHSAIHWYCMVYGLPLLVLGFVTIVPLGLIRVPVVPGPGRCRKCRYDLRGLLEPRCPECGTPFDPRRIEELSLRADCSREPNTSAVDSGRQQPPDHATRA